jgi:hypothetical protein
MLVLKATCCKAIFTTLTELCVVDLVALALEALKICHWACCKARSFCNTTRFF